MSKGNDYQHHICAALSRVRLCNPVDCSPLGSCPWGSPGKNAGVGCQALLQGIFPTQGLNPSLLVPCIAGGFFTAEPLGKPLKEAKTKLNIMMKARSFLVMQVKNPSIATETRNHEMHQKGRVFLTYVYKPQESQKRTRTRRLCSEGRPSNREGTLFPKL